MNVPALKRAMERKGVCVSSLASMVGVNTVAIYKLLKCRCEPSYYTMKGIHEALGLDYGVLFDDSWKGRGR